MKKLVTVATCPKCSTMFKNEMLVEDQQLTSPATRCDISPSSNIFVYRITSDDIKDFIIEKAKCLCPDAKVEVAPMYIERKRRNSNTRRISYATLKIAFSDKVIERHDSYGYYGTLGDPGDGTRIISSMFNEIYQKYRLCDADIDRYLGSYKAMERLEEDLGISEEYLRDLKRCSRPGKIDAANGEKWVFFSASVEKILKDMLSEPVQDPEVAERRRISIEEVYPLSKENVEFVVYLRKGSDADLPEDPMVRQILMSQGHNNKK